MTQPSQSSHLQESALAELDVANRQLADAGKTIDELRSDVLALAARVDNARAEAESFKNEAESGSERNTALKSEHQSLLSKLAADREAERTALESVNAGLEAHVARLKRQVQRPERLLAKKVLRRGPYAKPDAS